VAFEPTGEQLAILRHDLSRHARILAGPGTGKSATVIALLNIKAAILGAGGAKLLTFTRAATAELTQKLDENPNIACERPSTLHSFCISVLLRNPGLGDFPRPLRMADDWESDKIVEKTLSRRLKIPKLNIRTLFRELAANWESLVPEEGPKVTPAERARFLGAWREHREIFGYTLPSELPYALRIALCDHNNIEGTEYALLVVDEYQDLNSCDLDVLYRSHFALSDGSQENPVTDLMKPGFCRAVFQALQQASISSSTVSMTRLARKWRRSSCHSSSTGLSSGL
jgi:superfamily I DNA/RNA helicase